MARLIVQFPGDAAVIVDGAEAGRTNRVIPLTPGEHVVRLETLSRSWFTETFVGATRPGPA